MKKRWVTIAFAIFFVVEAADARQKIVQRSFDYRLEERSYSLYVPKSLSDAEVPLLLTFHGSGRDGESLVEKWTKLADRHGFIVAGLDSRDSRIWKTPDDGPEVVRSLVESLSGEFPIQERRVYAFGHSGGAVFTLILSLMESEYLAAAAVHAGSFRSPAEERVIPLATRGIPIKIIVGDRDRFFSVESVETTAEALREHGIPVEVEVVKGHDHWYYQKARVFNESAWRFLSAHELSTDPSFRKYR